MSAHMRTGTGPATDNPAPVSTTDPAPVTAANPAPVTGGVSAPAYVHGYSDRESRRLADQADALADLLHRGTSYPAGSRVLEAGCGVGAQTGYLTASSPGALITAVDHDPDSLARARDRIGDHPYVAFRRADIRELPWDDGWFDHVFVCFVLEHLADPAAVLHETRRVLRPGGTLTVIEGDHGSAFFHPDGACARAAIGALVQVQAAAGGDALMGRRVGPLLAASGFDRVAVEPRTVGADATRSELAEGFTRRTFTAMVAAVRREAVAAGLLGADAFDRGIAELTRTAEPGGSFFYTFVKATAVNPG